MICDKHEREYGLARLSEGGTGVVCSVCDDQQRIRDLTEQLAEARAKIESLRRYIKGYAESSGDSYATIAEYVDKLTEERDQARAEVERLRGHLTFLGAKETDEGLEIDMPKYHKAHRERGYAELKAEVERLREGLKRVEWIIGPLDDLYCMWCGSWKSNGHNPDCWLAALLKESPCQKP